ncbi:3'-5' exonuclease [Leisingera caerulea]|uniref:3'-5' exonuclease n=1 Tax=Leisingera caerulea TaxID=506591 RepID=UPI0021A8B9D2|nr:hypothetical protein [Leisingera caerulea]UWQ85015.1 hypothetical protein K3726_07380 [Leisingera caerulea]
MSDEKQKAGSYSDATTRVRSGFGSGFCLDMKVGHQSPVFIDFEASSLSTVSWPIEVGLAWNAGKCVVVESKLIRPRPEWPEADWCPESQAIHGIMRSELDSANSADEVVDWLLETVAARPLVSDAPEFDQRWLDRLLGSPGPEIDDFDRAVWEAFSDGGNIKAGGLQRVYQFRAKETAIHRAGDDAAVLCNSWIAGLGK